MVFDDRRLWFFHGEENFTATPCRLFYVAREGISPIMGVRIFTTLWVWLTTPLTKSLCFLWCHHGGRGHWMVGVSPVSVCAIRKLFPFWRQHSRVDSGRWAFGAVAGFVPICRWRRTGKRQNVYKMYTKTTAFFGKLQFLCLCIQKCRTPKFAYSGI